MNHLCPAIRVRSGQDSNCLRGVAPVGRAYGRVDEVPHLGTIVEGREFLSRVALVDGAGTRTAGVRRTRNSKTQPRTPNSPPSSSPDCSRDSSPDYSRNSSGISSPDSSPIGSGDCPPNGWRMSSPRSSGNCYGGSSGMSSGGSSEMSSGDNRPMNSPNRPGSNSEGNPGSSPPSAGVVFRWHVPNGGEIEGYVKDRLDSHSTAL